MTLYRIADKVVDLFERLNLFAVADISRRIADAEKHMTASADWQIYKLQQAGATFEAIRKETQKIMRASDAQIREIFEETIISGWKADAVLYRQAGVPVQPFNTEVARKNLQVFYEQTEGELYNFTRTTAIDSQTIYVTACDDAYLRVKSGLQSYSQAITQAIDKAAGDGLFIAYPSGHKDTVEVAVRRAVMTGVNQASLRMTIDECERQGTNFVIVSSHLGARVSMDKQANHAGWQGKVYKIRNHAQGFYGLLERFNDLIKGQNYPLLEEATGYPSNPLGLGGYNCRHSMYPYIPGISENHMQQFTAGANAKEYALSQQQRAMEREMRKTRRLITGYEAAEKNAATKETEKSLREARKGEQERFKDQMQKYVAFCEKNGLTEQRDRLYTTR